MTLHHSRPRSHRLAFALALLAVLAQLWMAQISTRHVGQMLWQQTLWGDVCTAHNSTYNTTSATDPDADSERSDPLPNLAHCPVCSAAAAGVAPGATQPPPLAAQALAPCRVRLASAPVYALRHTSLRPPAQAPPRA